MGAHALLMVVANYCYMQALAKGAVSETQPMLALTTVFLLITTPIMTNDVVTMFGWVGVVLVGVGVYATQHPGRDPVTGVLPPLWAPFLHMWKVPGVIWMFFVAVIYSIASNLDKLAVLSANGATYLMFDYAVTALLTAGLIGLGVSFKYVPIFSSTDLLTSATRVAPGGVLNAFGTLMQMWALTLLPVPYVIAIKRLSIVFTSLWGYFVRRERAPHWYRILGIFVVFFGLALILIYGKV
jgi:drug/metabolite transporter (DMT)-like permease